MARWGRVRLYQFTHWAVAVPGVVAVPPGAVAPERAPRLQGLARGLGGGARVGGAHGSGRCDRCPRRRVVRCRARWTGDLDPWSLWCTRPPGVAAPAVLARPDRLPGGADRVVGAPCGCRRPRPTMRPARTGPVTKAVQRGAPCRVGTRVKSTTQRRSAPGGGGSRGACGPSGDPVPGGGPGGAHRPARPGAGQTPAPACAAPAAHAGHPGALPPGARQPPGLPGSPRRPRRSGSAHPGRGSPLDPGAASEIDLLEGGRDRAAQVKWTGRSCTPARSGRCRSGTGPAAPPLRWSMHSADQRDGRSHCAAIEQSDALRPIAPPPPARADPRRRLPGAPGPLGGGAGPVPGDRPEPPDGSRPRRVPGPAPSPLRPRAANTPRAGPGRPGRPGANPIARRLSSSGRFPGAGMILIPPWIQTLHHTQDDPHVGW